MRPCKHDVAINTKRAEFKILLINPPHTAIGSRVPREQLPPLGLLSIGGPLLDAGFAVELLDAEFGPLGLSDIASRAQQAMPSVVMLGHSGSSSVHATVVELVALLKKNLPDCSIICGGVHPTYHWEDILRDIKQVDYIVRGEGERTALALIEAIYGGRPVDQVDGIALRVDARPYATAQAVVIENLDDYRVGWELIDHTRYSYWGGMRAVVVQFSRGCPYQCSYCGQRGFWTRYWHRDPVKFAKELARLHREQGVQLINFADELPTGSRKAWQTFLEALIAENVNLTLVGSTRTGDIVRDADILHLYRKAGVIRFLLGIESYEESTLKTIKKGATTSEDREAIRLLRLHGMISMATYVFGFEEESDADYWRSYRHQLRYDPDQIQMLYVTPHRWTPYYPTVSHRQVIEPDSRKWDYKHQVLATLKVPPWRVFLWVKAIEVMLQLRPKALLRSYFTKGDYGHAMRWYEQMGRRVWTREVFEFLFRRNHLKSGPTLGAFIGQPTAGGEDSMARRKTVNVPIKVIASANTP